MNEGNQFELNFSSHSKEISEDPEESDTKGKLFGLDEETLKKLEEDENIDQYKDRR